MSRNCFRHTSGKLRRVKGAARPARVASEILVPECCCREVAAFFIRRENDNTRGRSDYYKDKKPISQEGYEEIYQAAVTQRTEAK